MNASRRVYILVLALIFVAAICVVGYYLWEFIMVDKCLDAGGLWDYETKQCDTTPE